MQRSVRWRSPSWLCRGTSASPFLGSNAADAASQAAASVPTLPAGFQDQVALSGLTFPTAVRFASDGRVFVAEKSGLLEEFDSLSDSTPTQVADFRTEIDDYWDRGLLGLALDPNFPATPVRLRALRLRRAARADRRPSGTTTARSPPGPTTDGCPVQRQARPSDAVGQLGHRVDHVAHRRAGASQYPEPFGRRSRTSGRTASST